MPALATLLLGPALRSAAMAMRSNGNYRTRYWTSVDRCAAAAQRQFPDLTAKSDTQRDNAMKRCLANGNPPPRQELNY
jgi:hypothetical protein